MRTKELYQKRKFGNYRKHTLSGAKITVETKNERNTSRYDLNIFEIGKTLHYQKGNERPAKILVLILVLFFAAMIVSDVLTHKFKIGETLAFGGLYGIVIAFIYLKPINDDIFLTGGKKNLVFYRNIPDEATVLKFIDDINENKRQIMKDDFIKYDDGMQEEVYRQRLSFLKKENIITEDELNDYMDNFRLSRLL